MDKLEKLLILLQSYGVKSYSDQELSLTLEPIPGFAETAEEGFQIDFDALHIDNEEDPPN